MASQLPNLIHLGEGSEWSLAGKVIVDMETGVRAVSADGMTVVSGSRLVIAVVATVNDHTRHH